MPKQVFLKGTDIYIVTYNDNTRKDVVMACSPKEALDIWDKSNSLEHTINSIKKLDHAEILVPDKAKLTNC